MRKTKAGVIGGGIIGLAVARELLKVLPGISVTVFEKEEEVGTHQTGRNSGVVHAGLYYEPGSLKARLCRRGVGLLEDYAREKNVQYDKCGKLVVALSENEVGRLNAIHARAVENGVPNVRIIGREEIQEIEPHARGASALYSPETAIVDYRGIAQALANDVMSSGGELRLGSEVSSIEERPSGVIVKSDRLDDTEYDFVITCAGLQSDRLARKSGDEKFPVIVPFFGDYFTLSEKTSHLVKGLIYPVPDPRYPFLGVHLTKRIDGAVTLGPNAFLALAREGYGKRNLSIRDLAESIGFPGFWKFAARNMAAAVRESSTVLNPRSFVIQAQQYVPEISFDEVKADSRGIRAQAMRADGILEDDFVISGTAKILHVRNAPSPGATSALAIAEHIVSTALERRNKSSPSWTHFPH